MTQEQVAGLRTVIYNTMDFCGNPLTAAKEFCKENGIPWDRDSAALTLTFMEMYPK